MKKIQLIETGILATTLIFGYKFIDSIVTTLITTFYEITSGYGYPKIWSVILQYVLISIFYFGILLLLVKYNKQIAAYINRQGQPANPVPDAETIHLRIEQSSLLYVVLIALCLSTLISEMPVILISIYDRFKKEAGGYRLGDPTDLNLKSAAIKFVFSIIVLFYAKKISALLIKGPSPAKTLAETTDQL